MDKKVIEKEAIIAEYLTRENSYRKLGNIYGTDLRYIQEILGHSSRNNRNIYPCEYKKHTKDNISI